MDMDKPSLRDVIYLACYEYFNGEDRCKGCGHYAWQGTHRDDCHYGKLFEQAKSLEADPPKIQNAGGLPQVTDVPPMPECKPPKSEDSNDEGCDTCTYVLEADGWSGLTCTHSSRTGCTGHYQACDFYEDKSELKIESADQIIDKLIADGDLREDEFDTAFVCSDGDILGFYQQGCELLLKELAEIQTCKNGHRFIAKSHEYVCPLCMLDKIRNLLK